MPLTLLASSRGRAESNECSDGADLPGVMFVLRHISGLGIFFFPSVRMEKACVSWFEIRHLLILAGC